MLILGYSASLQYRQYQAGRFPYKKALTIMEDASEIVSVSARPGGSRHRLETICQLKERQKEVEVLLPNLWWLDRLFVRHWVSSLDRGLAHLQRASIERFLSSAWEASGIGAR